MQYTYESGRAWVKKIIPGESSILNEVGVQISLPYSCESVIEACIPLPLRWVGWNSDATLSANQVRMVLGAYEEINIKDCVDKPDLIKEIPMYLLKWHIPNRGGLNFVYLNASLGVQSDERVCTTRTELQGGANGKLVIARYVDDELSSVTESDRNKSINELFPDIGRVLDWMRSIKT